MVYLTKVEGFDSPQRANILKLYIMKNQSNKISEILFDKIGLEQEDVTDIQVSRFSRNSYYRFKVYSIDKDDAFALGSLLGEEYGSSNLFIESYSSTNKYRSFSSIEIRA